MHSVRVQTAPFDTGAEIAALLHGRHDIGGLATFLGTVRATPTVPRLLALTLEHYPGMTERALEAIAAKARARWPLIASIVIHRTGRLLPGDPIVLVATASPHRQAALDSTAFLIDWLKTSAPFWKQEEFEGRPPTWVEARADDDTATARWAHPTETSP